MKDNVVDNEFPIVYIIIWTVSKGNIIFKYNEILILNFIPASFRLMKAFSSRYDGKYIPFGCHTFFKSTYSIE